MTTLTLPPTADVRARLRELRQQTIITRTLLEAARQRDSAERERRRREEATHAS